MLMTCHGSKQELGEKKIEKTMTKMAGNKNGRGRRRCKFNRSLWWGFWLISIENPLISVSKQSPTALGLALVCFQVKFACYHQIRQTACKIGPLFSEFVKRL